MKISLNNQNVTLKHFGTRTADCYRCCFYHNWSLCGIVELRNYTICRTVKMLDETELEEIFKL